jgi:hypothetical protein
MELCDDILLQSCIQSHPPKNILSLSQSQSCALSPPLNNILSQSYALSHRPNNIRS